MANEKKKKGVKSRFWIDPKERQEKVPSQVELWQCALLSFEFLTSLVKSIPFFISVGKLNVDFWKSNTKMIYFQVSLIQFKINCNFYFCKLFVIFYF